ncbi:MAG: rod-binding protein [Buchnera aphidicola (Brevicoryne brassicae)]|uniref:Rod-binding protein n=1 Tax=Buchnera aphidicola (Brevicoryne brassicae) TaxID=911343 RepID=A0AAJ5PTU7_9GAMM|nr:rod-binding protein [Buchnera aphidicola]QCI19905.1 flagellar biosynthesis protein FlgJ [Buchnera aphidicola (Brevicoryne brassicae)]WAI18728.1 MAG: rod-binding protein [Buchnera aphidicola (Brevicoryne brassicae)]
MNNNLNILNHSTQFINELKYQVRNDPKKHLRQTAIEVESLFIQILLKSMRNALSEDNLLDSNQSRLYTEIYDQKISQEMSKKGIGLTEIILKQIDLKK